MNANWPDEKQVKCDISRLHDTDPGMALRMSRLFDQREEAREALCDICNRFSFGSDNLCQMHVFVGGVHKDTLAGWRKAAGME